MEADAKTLGEIKLLSDIKLILGGRIPTDLVHKVFNHLKHNHQDGYDHYYLLDSLNVAKRLIDHQDNLTEHDVLLIYTIILLLETGRPITKRHPYEVSPGVGWMFLRYYADGIFTPEDERFISQSCRPIKADTIRMSSYTFVELVIHTTKRLTDVVNQKYQKLYDEFAVLTGLSPCSKKLNKAFLEEYGPKGNLWDGFTTSTKDIFALEISNFKKKVGPFVDELNVQ